VRRAEMGIEFQCECGRTLRTQEEYAGRKGKCPACERLIIIPREASVRDTSGGLNELRDGVLGEKFDEKMPHQEDWGDEEATMGIEGFGERRGRDGQQAMNRSNSLRLTLMVGGLLVLLVALIGYTVMGQKEHISDGVPATEEATLSSNENQESRLPLTAIPQGGESNQVGETLPMKSAFAPKTELRAENEIGVTKVEDGETGKPFSEMREEKEWMVASFEKGSVSVQKLDPPVYMDQKTLVDATRPETKGTDQEAAEANRLGEQGVSARDKEPESIQKHGPTTEIYGNTMTKIPTGGTVSIDRELAEKTELAQLEAASLEEKVRYKQNLDLYSGKYTVNLGSFRKRARAERFAQGLSEKGLDAFWWEIDLPEKGKWNRVSVGCFESLENAERFVEQQRLREEYSVFITRIPGD
jgi:cell division septation protein DedD